MLLVPSGVGLLFRNGFCLLGIANLHLLPFYTIKVTSPGGLYCLTNRMKWETLQPGLESA